MIKAAQGDCQYYVADLGKISEVKKVAKAIQKDFEFIDVIINNAGAGQWLEIEKTSMQEAEEMMRVPYFAAFHITRAFIETMLEKNKGHIVNVTSPASEFYIPGALAYSVGRWAMRGFSQALWADLYGTNIKVSLFVAGKIASEYFKNNPGSEERIPGISKFIATLSVEEAAKALLDGVEKEKKMIIVPFMLKVFYLSSRFFPGFTRYLSVNTGYNRKKIKQ